MYTELFNPLYGTVDGLPVIAVGAVSYRLGDVTYLEFVLVDGDGSIGNQPADKLVVDTRFVDGQWHDTSPGALDATE